MRKFTMAPRRVVHELEALLTEPGLWSLADCESLSAISEPTNAQN